jgi:hypothetical protein
MISPFPAEHHSCRTCAVDYRHFTVTRALVRTADGPGDVARRVQGLPDEVLRHRPAAGWSVLEYVCHLRDVYATYTIRLFRSRTEDCPRLEPMYNDLRAVRFRYNDLALEHVLAELAGNAQGLHDEVAQLTVEDLERPVLRRPGECRSALWLIRQAAHETVHHLGDLDRLIPAHNAPVASLAADA